ncbi:MAG TPA: superoxide dismutase [Allosphingosinicella sp.]|nr:superoxide dismutase [Allosphingosinicella sp.]
MLLPQALRAQARTADGPFTLPRLPYAYDSLAPVIDARTMEIHHGRHHRAYVDNLNNAVAATPALRGLGIEALVARAGTLPTAVRNNAGGHWNHGFFWESMIAPDRGGAPSPALAAAIDRAFGSLDAMKTAFNAAGASRFGSGWAWLILGTDGRLAVSSTPNQDNPLMDVAEVKGEPLLGNDVWEHAYYLNYQNRRADYLTAWWRVVDWDRVSRRYRAATRRR